ncbi:hypothetical protein O6H91_02G100800 [Diphasiastrum complanatum]|uniref:Uncharacterized protein n=1 Tax=Diphasiastrum complanatum TaxID=34168 RepID=A0ACC2EIG0_DIPCM|nr:hypothetical protein O6H91_02G100800 [Diphasiastrum complanatum]
MVSSFAGFGLINFQLLLVSSETVRFRDYSKPLDKHTRVHPSSWQEEQSPAHVPQSTEHDIRPAALISGRNQPYRPSLRPSLETIDEQESQICHSATRKVRCLPFRLRKVRGRNCKGNIDWLFSRTRLC